MKTATLSIALILFALPTIAQISLTNADEGTAGDTTSYFLMDSLAPNLASIDGANVTWDYSTINAYGNSAKRKAHIMALASSDYASFFTGATVDAFIEDHIHDFYKSSASERLSYGLQASEDNNGDFLITYNPRQTRTFPWTFNSKITGAYNNAKVTIDPNGSSQASFNANGNYLVESDGYGSIKIGDSTISDVIRIHLYDSVRAIIAITNATLISNQYEYYVKGNPFPIFIHSDIRVYGASLSVDYTLVLSQIPPFRFTGVNDLEKESATISLYPNPATDILTISGFNSTSTVQLKIYDLLGKVQKSELIGNGQSNYSTSIAVLPAGTYTVELTTDQKRQTKKLMIVR